MSEAQQHTPYLEVQRIFVKNLSLETPNTPYTFDEEWKPEVNLNLEAKSNRIAETLHEVILSITATVTTMQKTAFLVEVQQAGTFAIVGFETEQLHQLLGSYCPALLFPYARSVIAHVVILAGFPQLLLAHVNFDALYAQQLQAKTEEENGKIVH